MFKSESFLKNETHKILSDFEIQTDPLFPAVARSAGNKWSVENTDCFSAEG